MRCKGVSTETCGGPDRLDVYQLSSSGALGTTTITTSTYFSTTTVTVVSAPTSSTVVHAMTTPSASPGSTKRGILYNNNNPDGNAEYGNLFKGYSKISWAYDWGYPSDNLDPSFELYVVPESLKLTTMLTRTPDTVSRCYGACLVALILLGLQQSKLLVLSTSSASMSLIWPIRDLQTSFLPTLPKATSHTWSPSLEASKSECPMFSGTTLVRPPVEITTLRFGLNISSETVQDVTSTLQLSTTIKTAIWPTAKVEQRGSRAMLPTHTILSICQYGSLNSTVMEQTSNKFCSYNKCYHG
jgi:hypothetical protein